MKMDPCTIQELVLGRKQRKSIANMSSLEVRSEMYVASVVDAARRVRIQDMSWTVEEMVEM